MIKIFGPNDRVFTTNGDAVIKATRANVHKVDNGDYYLEIECGLEYIDFIKANNIIVVPTPQGDQAFRIEAPTETTRTKIRVKAWHVFYDSENYVIPDTYIVDKNCNAALDQLNNHTDNPSPFTTLSDVGAVRSFRCVRKSLYEGVMTILERWGGHLVRDNFSLQIRNVIGADNGVTIQYKKNLKEITVSEDWSEVCTKCLPVGADGFLLDELYLYSDTQYAIPYTKTVSFDQSHIEEDQYPDEDSYKEALREDLIAQATAYLNVAQYPKINYTLSANMDKITDVGDIVEVYDERLGVSITASVLSFDYDCILGQYTQVEFGTAGASLSDLMSNVSTEISTAITESTANMIVNLQAAIEVAEARIWEALGSSYCIYSGDQILIVDSLPAETARNCIRINSGGIAFSQNGVNGHFTTAWTIDGTFNAQAINVINFTADLIKGGTLKLGSNLNQYGSLMVYNESNTLIAQLDKSGLLMYGVDGSYLVMNTTVGFAGYDRLGNKIFYADKDEFHMKKSVVEEEITLCNKMRFIPIEVYDQDDTTLLNDGIGLVSVISQ